VLCRIGERSPEVVYSDKRLLHPMRRRGPKGSLEFERISWDEAYDEIVERFEAVKRESGPEATAIYTGSGSFELAMCDIFQPEGVAVSSASSVLFPFGSPNTLGVGALCYVSFAMIAPHVTMGGMFIDMFSDIEHADLIVIWGKNPAAHCPPHDFYRIQEAHARGAEIVVIDPRRTRMADFPGADWIPIRPGTDGALALGLCRVLIEEELHDEGFARDWTVGFEEFARYVQHFRPETVEHVTGVPAETVVDLARRFARADGVAPVMYSGLEYSDGAVQAIRATFVLWALAGQLDVPGGHCFKMRDNAFPLNRGGHVPNPDVRKAAGYANFPVYTKYRGEFHANILPKAVLEGKPYPIRALFSLGASIITSWPQSDVWRRTLAGLDFLVCVDRQWTADMAYADILLPAATYYEIESYMIYDNVFRLRERIIEPVGEARNDFFIQAELARRLGYGHLYPQSEEELFRRVLEGSGFTLEGVREAGGIVRKDPAIQQYRKWEKGLLRPDGRPGFDTPSGKFEIASSILEEYGYDPLPIYTEPGEGPRSDPGLAREYPLVFNSGARSASDLHTLHHSVPSLTEEKPVPTVMIQTEDARARGIETGDPVDLSTPRGTVRMFAIVTDDIVRGAIEASGMGGGVLGPKEWREACVNDLTDLERYDPISGFPVYKALLCDVVKAGVGDASRVRGDGQYERAGTRSSKGAAATRRIYLDHNATTPMHAEVKRAMTEHLDDFGNPSSIYATGKASRAALEEARRKVAHLLGCTARRITFTGGGSEANNLAIKGTALPQRDARPRIVTSSIEHPSVLETCRRLERDGFEVTYLPVDGEGRVRPQDLARAIDERTCLVTIMLANNETGAIQPVKELAAMARERGARFHTDAVQAVGKIPVDVEDLGVDLLTLSGHKLQGPKGIGALYARAGVELEPLVYGGHQERGWRAGTENVPAIVGLGKAAELAIDHLRDADRVRALRDRLERGILAFVPDARVNGPAADRLPNTLNVTLPGLRGESVVLALDERGVCASSGSACQSGHPDPSHALLAMGLDDEAAHCSLRLSLGYGNEMDEVEEALAILEAIVSGEESVVRFVSCR
jgi:cysteine desulfurase NifS